MPKMITVYDFELDAYREVTEAEARAGMLRYAKTLGLGRATVEDQATNGDIDTFPPHAWLRP